MSSITYSRVGTVAVIVLTNPPVNSLGAPTRQALQLAFRSALADPEVEAIVITGSGKLFSGGADISEFQADLGEPGLPDLLREIELSPKPVTAAINGIALGGGLELALVCHFRVAVAKARLGLPEVSIGVIPGAGGTQRLPRLIGVERALDIITSGKPVSAAAALNSGLIDRILPGDDGFLDEAIAFARARLDTGSATNARAVERAETPSESDFFETARAKVGKANRGRVAPLRALDSVINSTLLPLDEGLAEETRIFLECNASAEARALQHIFFAERKAAHIRNMPSDVRSRPLAKVAIIGAGTMGGGIAMNFLNAGIPVVLVDMNNEALTRGLSAIRNNYAISVARGRFTADDVEARLGLLEGVTGYDAVDDADLVIEAVFENLDVKKKVFAELDRMAKPGALLATNTSTLDVDAIAAATNRPQDVIGLHFFSPANVMRLVEIVRGRESAPDAVKTALDMCKRIGKVGVVVGVCFGFVGNRMLEPYSRETHRLLLEGATPEAIDRILTDFGMSMGPFAMYDMAGIDVGALVRKENRAAIGHDPSYCRLGDLLAERGESGQKNGRGFYVYQGRERHSNPELPELIEREAKALGIARRSISDQEIFERCLFPLIDEGIRILEEGIAQRPGDIDVIWCNGYGFPNWRGGPMHWADEYGLDRIYAALTGYRQSLGEHGRLWFDPSSTLGKLAGTGQRLTDIFPNS